MSAVPRATRWAARISAAIEEQHCMFTVNAGTECGTPARIATIRAGFDSVMSWRTIPAMTSSTDDGSMPTRSSRDEATVVPYSVARSDARLPPNLPIGLLSPSAMNTSRPMGTPPLPPTNPRSTITNDR